nr:MAG TPA: tail protein [Caudoviricetes sp.]
MGFPESVTVKQYDDQIPHVRVELRQNGVKYVIPSGTTLRMQGTKPDKTHFMYDAIRTDDGRIDCPLTNQILAAEGPILAEIRLTDTTGELATFNFYILAQKAALSREDIESSDDYQSIDKIKADTLQYKKDAEAAKATAEAAKEAAAGSANTATQQAQTAQLEAQKVKQIVAGNEAYTKTESDLKYTVAPRKEASSDTGELKLTDADDGLSYLELQGNSEQYTNTANKNLIDLHFATDGYYVNNVNGALAVNPNYKASGYINVIPGESYFLTNASQASPGAMYNANKVYVQGVVNGLNVIPEGVKYVRISATIAGSTQFEKGTQGTEIVIGAVDTPSPDYPSEVRSVGDIPKDVNGVEIRNLLDEEWIKSQPESAGTKDSSGTVFSIEVALPKTRLYIRTPDFNATDAEGTTFGISKRPGSLAAVDGIYFYKTTLGSFDFSGQEHIYIILGRQDKNWDLAKKSLMKSRLMVTSAAEIDEYRPYIGENNGLIKLESSGINRADAGDGPILMGNGNNIEVNTWTPRKIVLAQKNKSTSWAYAELNVERGKTYTFYCKAKVEVIEGTQTDGITKIGFRQYPPSGIIYGQTILSQDGQYKDIYNTTGVIPDDVPNMAFMIYLSSTSASNGNVKMTIEDLMVVEGERTLQEMKALKYQPYHQQITWIPLREPLRAMKTDYNVFSDTVDKNGNVTKKIQKMKMSELTTAESYWDADLSGINTKSSNIKFAYYKMDNDYRPADARTDIPCLCNKLKYSKNGVTPVVESIWHTQVIVFQIKNTRTGLSDAETDRTVIKRAIRDYITTNDYTVYYLLNQDDFFNYQIPVVYIETYDQETNVRCLNKVKPSDMTVDYKIAMSSLIKRLEALEAKTIQEV